MSGVGESVPVQLGEDDESSDEEKVIKTQKPLDKKRKSHRKLVSGEKRGASADLSRIAKGLLKSIGNTSKTPAWIKPYLKKAETLIPFIATVFRAVSRVLGAVWEGLSPLLCSLKETHWQIYIPAILGLIMVFYGGAFMFLIAAVEAYRISGWEKTQKCMRDLYRNYSELVEADAIDDKALGKISEGDEGKSIEEGMTDEQYLRHKVELLFAVVRPQQVMDAVHGITSGFFAVVATIRMKFAESITLGSALGEMGEKYVKAILLQDLEEVAGKYQRWVSPCLGYLCRIVGISIAYTLQRVLFAFHSAFRGAHLIVLTIAHFLSNEKRKVDHETDLKLILAKVVIGTLGFVKQLVGGFEIYFPLSIFFLPAICANWIIGFAVAYWN
mmetsp:Transcript_22298/g.31179  ORF Transcript_22298/g.31179 Transcript_22298/m.31179 type:complete len:385 (-) Transcript_22298:189-1343(-)